MKIEETVEVVEEYAHSCRIVREDGDEPRFHYEGALGRVKSFSSLEKARLYADVQTVTGGFREEKTGERGVPPAVARAREDVLMASLATQLTMGFEWAARFFSDVEDDVVRDYIRLVQERAASERDSDSDA